MKQSYVKKLLLLVLPAAFLSTLMPAQCAPGCGTGADGVYTASANTTLAGGTYNYSSFTIDAGVTVNVTGSQPLVINCTGNVTINGTLMLSGLNGTNGITYISGGTGGAGVAGGQNGGDGVFSSSLGPLDGSTGNGAGAGGRGSGWSGGGGAGYSIAGDNSGGVGGFGGPAYGNPQINPAVGGSGGGGGSGGYDCGAGGGGGGGGYVLISTCGTITIGSTGSILAEGGDGGSDGTGNCGGGGGGSGGSILLMTASSITNNGLVSATGGIGGASNVPGNPYYGTGANGAPGRIFYNYQTLTGTGSTSPVPTTVPTLLSATSATGTTCSASCDGTLIGTATGGTSPYTYNWMPGNHSGSFVNNVCAGNYTLTVTDANACTTTSTVTVTSPSPIVITGTVINASCFCDGSITATPSGGTGPYTYLWMPTALTTPTVTGLCAGCYTITVTDASGCVESQLFCVTAPAPLTTAMGQVNNVSCNGLCNGTATVVPSGGSGPFTYSWAPGGCSSQSCANLCPATYTVTTTDSIGCTSTATFTITEPDALIALATSNGVNCFGDCSATAVASVFGGTPNYTVLWAPGGETQNTITNLCAGTYTVTATDANGCVTTSTTTVTSPPQLQAVTTSTSVPCFGDCNGTAAVSLSGGTPGYTYAWAPGNGTGPSVTGLCAGTYTVTGTDASGCEITSTTTVTSPTQLAVTSSHTDETNAAANDGTATATPSGGTPGYTYLWMPGSQTTAIATGLNAGTYTCTITDANGCTTTTTVTIGTMSGINSPYNSLLRVDLFPNPAQDHVQIAITLAQKGNVHIELYNIIGEKIDALDFGNVNVINYSYTTSQLPNGIYFFTVTSGSLTTTKKITVSH
jgi:hypothetical protein